MVELLAPNGKPSNLTPEQYKLVRKPEFKAWFGDWEKLTLTKIKDSGIDEVSLKRLEDGVSKVVDENGEPLVVYHGTPYGGFYEFDLNSVGKNTIPYWGEGVYLTTSKSYAKGYAENKRTETQQIYNLFAKCLKPYIVKRHLIGRDSYMKMVEENQYNDFNDFLIDNNYDSVIILDGENIKDAIEIMTPLSNQIKLADGTNTTFDGNNPDIRFDDGGDVKTDFNDYENSYLRKAMLSIWNDFINGYISYYLDVSDESYVISDENVMVICRDKLSLPETVKVDKNFSAIEKVKIDNWFQLYCDLDKNPNIAPYIVSYKVEENKILIYFKSDKIYKKGGLLAPNGKPSNLTPEQHELVRSHEFKAWFGDWENDPANASRVVDSNGEPLVVYHYARRLQYELDRFFVFRTTKQLGSHFGSLSQISNLSDDAKYKIDENELDFRFYEVFLNIRKPIRMRDTPYWENQDLLNALNEKHNIFENQEWQDGETYAKFYTEKYDIDGIIYLNRYETKNELTDIQEERLTDKEFKQLVPSAEDSWIAFKPNQIKLADGTNTTFDGNNPDIRFDKGGSVLLAPNGKPSNLTPEQHELVRSHEFKAWFGDWENDPANASKVVDENGEPKVMYRGNRKSQEDLGYEYVLGHNFLNKENPNNFGFFFTDDIDVAKKYGGRITQVFLNVKNLFDLTELGIITDGNNFIKHLEIKGISFKGYEKLKLDILEYDRTYDKIDNKQWHTPNIYDFFDVFPELKYFFQYRDYNAVVFKETSRSYFTYLTYAIFEPNQIKLADGTNTTFDGSNPDIRFDGGGIIADNIFDYLIKEKRFAPLGKGFWGKSNCTIKIDFSNVLHQEKGENRVWVSPIEYSDYKKAFTILEFHCKDKNKGIGTALLKEIIQGADLFGYTIFIEPTSMKKYSVETDINTNDLKQWYSKYDFKPLNDNYSDYVWLRNPNNPDIRFDKGGNLLLAPKGKSSNLCNYFKEKSTGLPFYDDILNNNNKETDYKIVNMSVDDYFRLIRDEQNKSYPKEYHLMKFSMQKEKVFEIMEKMKKGVKYDMPLYDFRDGFQEGRHRLIAVSNLGCKNVNVALFGENIQKELDKIGIKTNNTSNNTDIRFDKGGSVKINPTEIECHKCHWKWKVKDGGDDLFMCHKCDADNTKFYKFEGLEGEKILDTITFKKGGRTIAQTPAPKKDQIKGSDKNPKGSSSSKEKAKDIKFSPEVTVSIKNNIDKHNKSYPKKKVDINTAKAVVRRGMGAYSSSYRPTISGGKANSRVAWALARLNAFLYKIVNGKSKSGKYSQDDDLIKALGYKVAKYNSGGQVQYVYVYAYKGEKENPLEEVYITLEKNTINEINATNYFLDNDFKMEKISKEDYDSKSDSEFDEYSIYNSGGELVDNQFKDFNYTELLNHLVPSEDDSLEELRDMSDIETDSEFVKKADDVKSYFLSYIIENNIPVSEEDANEVMNLIYQFNPIVVKLKEHFKRDRPYVFAQKNGIQLNGDNLGTEQSYSFPSAHAVQSRFVAHYLSEKYPENKDLFFKISDEIAESRINAKVHFYSDIIFGKFVADKLFEYYSNNEMNIMEEEYNKGGKIPVLPKIAYSDGDFLSHNDFLSYLNKINYKINDRQIVGITEWYENKLTVNLDGDSPDEEIEITYDFIDGFITYWDGENHKLQKAEYKWDLTPSSYNQPIFDSVTDAKKYFNLIKNRLENIGYDKPKLKVIYKYLLTKDTKQQEIPNTTEEDVRSVLKDSVLKFEKIDYSSNNYSSIGFKRIEVIYNLEMIYVYNHNDRIRVVLIYKSEKNKWYELENNMKIQVDFNFLPTGKVNKINIEVDFSSAFSELKQNISYENQPSIIEIINNIKSLVKNNFASGGQTDAQQEKIAKVMGEFKRGELNTSYGTKVTDDKQAIAIALSEAGVEKKEEGGVIEGQLHADCDSESGCGEKFDVGGTGHIIEAERGEAVIVSNAFKDSVEYTIVGTPSQIASALNVMGGGKNFDGGAKINFGNGKIVDTDKLKKETTDIDVKDDIESGSVIINRRSMFDKNVYEVKGTPKQIASAINSVNGNGVVIQQGAVIKKV